jgi:hypothetical protein
VGDGLTGEEIETGEKVFDAPVSSTGQALEWPAAMCSHIPDRGEQMVRY